MTTRGRKPTPRNLRLVTGAKRRPNAAEPIVEVSVPETPDHLVGDEIEIFETTGARLARMRVMTDADVDALSIFAVNFCRWKASTSRVREMGMVVKSPKGYPIQNPYLAIANKAQKICMDILTEFGLTPSSRTRVNKQ